MKRIAKRLLRRPFTYVELRSDSDSMFRSPPGDQQMRDALAGRRGKTGESMLDFWRSLFDATLQAIAERPTWSAQRAALLDMLIRQDSWRALQRAADECKTSDAWHSRVQDTEPFDQVQPQDRKHLLFERYLMAVMLGAALHVVGERFYDVSEHKRIEIQLLLELESEITKSEVRLLDYACMLQDSGDPDQAHAVAEWGDEEFFPVVGSLRRYRGAALEQVIHGTLDVENARRTLDEYFQRKKAVVEALRRNSAIRDASYLN